MALEHIDPYPWFLNKPLDLVVNEQTVRTRITSSQWADSWRPFLARLYDKWIAHFPKRYLIAVAGPPGAGKSVFAEQLHFIIDKGALHKDAHTIALPMDGFHYPNALLAAHTRKLPDGTEIPLSTVKGQPDTIDVVRLRKYVSALVARPEYVPWPGYSRYVHDVVPEKFKVHSSINLIIIEGNYLLLNRGPFQGLPEMFDLRVYLDAPAPHIIANLVDRHISGGKSIEQAKDWVKRVDLPNARLVESTKHQADVVLERDSDDDVASVTWKEDEPTTAATTSAPAVTVPVPSSVASNAAAGSQTHADIVAPLGSPAPQSAPISQTPSVPPPAP